MIEQEIYLERYDWTIHVMYDVHSKEAIKFRRHLRDVAAFLSKMPVISCSKVKQTKVSPIPT